MALHRLLSPGQRHCLYLALFSSVFLPIASPTILLRDHFNNTFGPYESQPAAFGNYISPEKIYFSSLLYDDRYPRGCNADAAADGFKPKVLKKETTLLVIRGGCDFEEKARFAQNYSDHITSLLVYDDYDDLDMDDYYPSDTLHTMTANNPKGIYVQSMFVSWYTGEALRSVLEGEGEQSTNNVFEYDGVGQFIDPGTWFLIMVLSVFIVGAGCGSFCYCVRRGFIRNQDGVLIIGRRSGVISEGEFDLFEDVLYFNPALAGDDGGDDDGGGGVGVGGGGGGGDGDGGEGDECGSGYNRENPYADGGKVDVLIVNGGGGGGRRGLGFGRGKQRGVDKGEGDGSKGIDESDSNNSTNILNRTSYFATKSCVVCLEDFVHNETLKMLPCKHAFHPQCIKPWVTERQALCPLCKECCKGKGGKGDGGGDRGGGDNFDAAAETSLDEPLLSEDSRREALV